jgi:hypothetical protein
MHQLLIQIKSTDHVRSKSGMASFDVWRRRFVLNVPLLEQSAMIPANDHRSGEVRDALLAVASLALTTALVLVGLMELADALGPQLGDIVSFPASMAPSFSTASITVSPTMPSSNPICVLDVQVMHRFGGSFVIEARPGADFQVHWAGLQTSYGRENCGGSADLRLNRAQLGALIFAAGGKGVKAAGD